MMAEKAHILRNSLIHSLAVNLPAAILISYCLGALGVAIGYGLLLFGQHLFASIALARHTDINIIKFYTYFGGK